MTIVLHYLEDNTENLLIHHKTELYGIKKARVSFYGNKIHIHYGEGYEKEIPLQDGTILEFQNDFKLHEHNG